MDKQIPVRIAHIMGKMGNGGVDAVVMNYYRHIDRSKIQFDFIIDDDSPLPKEIENEIIQLGGIVYRVAPYQNILKNIKDLKQIFKENNYKIVHSHLTTMSVFSLKAAKDCNIPVRICHGHNTACKGEIKKNILKYTLRPFSKLYATHYFACSKYAGEWLFGKKIIENGNITIINNAIDTKKFMFNSEIRKRIRQELNIESKFVIGHIGRFVYQKNHKLLIDIFYEVHKQNKESVLVLIGEGQLFSKIKEKVKKLNLDDCVLFLGNKNDIYKFYQAFDIFVLPSRYEGLGMVAIEAQVSGLDIVCSDCVPNETNITNNISYIPLKSSLKKWTNIILNLHNSNRTNIFQCKDYDIQIQSELLLKIYEKLGGVK